MTLAARKGDKGKVPVGGEAERFGKLTLQNYRDRNIEVGVKIALAFAVLGAVLAKLGAVRNENVAFFGCVSLGALMAASLVTRKKFRWVSITLLPFLALNMIILCSALAVHINVKEGAEVRYLISSLVAFSFAISFSVQMSTFRGKFLLVLPFLYAAILIPLIIGEPWGVQFAFFTSIASILNSISSFYNDHHIQRSAGLEHQAREVLNEAREMERQSDLQLARAIQEAPSQGGLAASERVAVSVYQTKHQGVGGDWLGWRTYGEGATAAVVADACGKGVHAALVVRTVQTLWASWLTARAFKPEEAFAELNDVLLALGGSGNQVATMGLLTVEGRNLTYWSAGHVPAFARLVHQGGDAEIIQLVARGSMLGFGRDLQLKCVKHQLPVGSRAHVLLGSDGAFPEGTRYSKSQVAEMFRQVESKGDAYLQNLETEDDRSLMLLDLAA